MSSILILLGSLSAGALNRKIANIAVENASERVSITIFEGLADVPFYNQDIDTDNPPTAVIALRNAVATADALLIVTPQYNGTIPAVLKNAIDWASRPYGASVLQGKSFGVIGTSAGRDGGIDAIEDAKKALVIAGAVFVEGILLAVPASAYGFDNPKDHPETVAKIVKILNDLAAILV